MTDRQLSAKLRAAVAAGDHRAIQRLIKGGVDINMKFWYDSTLLHEAVSMSQEGLVEMLISIGADVNSTNQDGRTPLHLACRGGQLRIVKMLIAAGTNLNKRTLDGKTCLHVAVWRGHLEVVQELVNAGADANIPDSEGCTSVYWAARSNYLPVLEVLVKAGAKINYRVKNKWTPLLMALHLGHIDIVRYLLQHGSETNLKLEGKSVVTLLMENRHLTQDMREQTLDMFITAGYQVQNETWTPEQASAGPKDVKPTAQELAQKQQMADYIEMKKETIPKLSSLCRTRIRKRMSYCNKGRSITGLMTQLPVPIIIAEYLEFKGDPLLDPSVEHPTGQ